MRIKDENLRDEILSSADNLISMVGVEGLTIRLIANRTGISSGSIYNYFKNKDEIISALSFSYFEKVFDNLSFGSVSSSFLEEIEKLYQYLSLRVSDIKSISALERVEDLMKEKIIILLNNDPLINNNVWDNSFNEESFASFISSNIILSLSKKDERIDFLCQIIKKTIY